MVTKDPTVLFTAIWFLDKLKKDLKQNVPNTSPEVMHYLDLITKRITEKEDLSKCF